MQPYWRDKLAAASSIHQPAKEIRETLDAARANVLLAIGGNPTEGDIIFTGSGTEAVNLGILGCLRAHGRFGRHAVASVMEHPAILNSLEAFRAEGGSLDCVQVDSMGRMKLDRLADALTDETLLLALQLASPELGTVQDLSSVASATRDRGVVFFVDATEAVGRVPVDVAALRPDIMAFSASSFGGPPGVGLLYKRSRISLSPLYYGGEQEQGLRPGEENVPLIVGTGIAADELVKTTVERQDQCRERQRRLLDRIRQRIEGVRMNGPEPGPTRLCHQLSLTIEGVEAEGLVLFADMRGLAFATAGGCLSRSLETHYVLEAAGLSPREAKQTISLGVSAETTEGEIDEAVEILVRGVERLRAMSPSWSSPNG